MVVGVLPNLDKRGADRAVEEMAAIFKANGIIAYISDKICSSGYRFAPEEDIYKLADVIITVGGDGTVIRYAKLAAAENKPVLGINAGRLGYLCSLERTQLSLLERLKTGNYKVENRMTLSITVKEKGVVVSEFTAVNDVVISSGFISRLIDITAGIDNGQIGYRADGLIVATPTGSTAYTLSAGGPISDPTAENIILTPICSHSLDAKPIIVGSNKQIVLTAFSRKRSDIYLLVDGRKSAPVKPQTEIIVKKSEIPIKLINITDRSFYQTLSEKFSGVQ